MRVFAGVLLAVSSAVAYQVTFPTENQGWTTSGPNVLKWERVDTDPSNFAVFLTNMHSTYSQILDSNVDGTSGSVVCSEPAGGWPTGSTFRVNIARDAQHPNSLLAQSGQIDITSSGTSGSAQTATSATKTSSASGVSSSNTSTSPTGTGAASLSVVVQAGFLAVVAISSAFVVTVF